VVFSFLGFFMRGERGEGKNQVGVFFLFSHFRGGFVKGSFLL